MSRVVCSEAAAGTGVGESSERRATRAGLAYGLSAYTMWGVFPIYFHAVAHVPPFTVLLHRIFWSALFLGLVITVRGEWRALAPLVRRPRNLALLLAGSVLIALNWLLFIYAVGSGQILQSSLGYFINPLLSVALGVACLRERLRRGQWVAVLLAVVAVANLTVRGGGFPWLAVALAGSFGFYGLVRKTIDTNSLHALLVETALLFPVAALLLALAPPRAFSAGTWTLLFLSGVTTAVPLLLFGAALRRLTLTAVGFLQYLGPTLQFLVAVVVYRERLESAKLASFALCWLAIGVYVVESLIQRRPPPVADEPD